MSPISWRTAKKKTSRISACVNDLISLFRAMESPTLFGFVHLLENIGYSAKSRNLSRRHSFVAAGPDTATRSLRVHEMTPVDGYDRKRRGH